MAASREAAISNHKNHCSPPESLPHAQLSRQTLKRKVISDDCSLDNEWRMTGGPTEALWGGEEGLSGGNC